MSSRYSRCVAYNTKLTSSIYSDHSIRCIYCKLSAPGGAALWRKMSGNWYLALLSVCVRTRTIFLIFIYFILQYCKRARDRIVGPLEVLSPLYYTIRVQLLSNQSPPLAVVLYTYCSVTKLKNWKNRQCKFEQNVKPVFYR